MIRARRLRRGPSYGLLGMLVTAAAAVPVRAAPAGCGDDAIVLPILSENGAVVVPAEVNGVPVAAAVNPHAFPSFVSDPSGLGLPRLGSAGSETLAGRDDGYETVMARLRIGNAVFPGLHAVVVPGPPAPPVAGRPVAVTLGADLLDEYVVLMDLPNRRLLLFPVPGPAACPDPAAGLSGFPATVPLRDAPGGRRIDVVDAVLDGLPVAMEINPSSNDTVVPRSVARRLGLDRATLDRDPQVLTRAADSRVGRRHAFGALVLGSWVVRAPRIDVQPDLSYAALGLDLLNNRRLLFDFPGRRLLFDPAPPVADAGRASALSDVRTRNADTAVEQAQPAGR